MPRETRGGEIVHRRRYPKALEEFIERAGGSRAWPTKDVDRRRDAFQFYAIMASELVALLWGRPGHFRMESGYHSERWFDLDRTLAQRAALRPFEQELGRRLAAHQIQAVCGPMTGGAEIAARIASDLGLRALHAERQVDSGTQGLFPVNYRLPPGQRDTVRGVRVAIVDDAISAGSAIRGTYADLISCGAMPVAIGALFIFGPAAARFSTEHALALEGVAALDHGIWPPHECPLCRAGVTLERVSD